MCKPWSLGWAWWCREWSIPPPKKPPVPKSCTTLEAFCQAQQYTSCIPMPRRGWPSPDEQGEQNIACGLTALKYQNGSKASFQFLEAPYWQNISIYRKVKEGLSLVWTSFINFSRSPKTRRSCREVCLPIGSDMRTTLAQLGGGMKWIHWIFSLVKILLATKRDQQPCLLHLIV